ncbi:TRAM domain-containing protein [Natronosalvus rutilus]|uniref:TRAM domain-containing protein n=1 Tax=Natronosalvus rutilus TaxID=2953753 RepID=A0A9E7SVG1_9EURY|nr:TRAM domain-containing protein [Natronosalvus rutilus]UTF55824.1 TRAM domain-containing protein [Natronosalvus rutilus]
MEIPDNLLCLFNAEIVEEDGSYFIEIPNQEVAFGDVTVGEVYRAALLGSGAEAKTDRTPQRESDGPTPPVETGETRTVDIEGTGEQGDGIARVERGYVVIVPDTEKGERVTIEITDVKETVAFAEVLEREEYYP